MNRGSWKLYPNLFTILVGRPGIGKGGAVNPAYALLKEANSAHVLSDRLTIEFVLETLSKGFSATVPGATPQGFTFGKEASAMIFAPELSIFISSSHTLQILNDLWDSRGDFAYGTRHKGDWKIKDPCISLLAASAPDWLVRAIPNDAVGGGFTRRVNFVLAKTKQQSIPWPISTNGAGIVRAALVDDLKRISQLRGEIRFSSDAARLFESVYGSVVGDWEDEATASYITTRWAHTTKLAMVFSAARADDLTITLEDFERANALVETVVGDIKTVFRGAGTGDYVTACDKILTYLELKPGATRKEIMGFIWKYIHTAELDVCLATLEQGGKIRSIQMGPNTVYLIK